MTPCHCWMTFLKSYIILITQETCREKNLFGIFWGFSNFYGFCWFYNFFFFIFFIFFKLCTKDMWGKIYTRIRTKIITPQLPENSPLPSFDMLKSNVSTFNQGLIQAFHSPLISALPQSWQPFWWTPTIEGRLWMNTHNMKRSFDNQIHAVF